MERTLEDHLPDLVNGDSRGPIDQRSADVIGTWDLLGTLARDLLTNTAY